MRVPAWTGTPHISSLPTSLAQLGKNRLPIGNFAWLNALARRSQRQTVSGARIAADLLGCESVEVHLLGAPERADLDSKVRHCR